MVALVCEFYLKLQLKVLNVKCEKVLKITVKIF